MTARDDFRAAVREAATYRSSDLGGPGTAGYLLAESQFAAIFEAAEAYRREALLSVAAEIETEADEMRTDIGRASFLKSARMARERVQGSPG